MQPGGRPTEMQFLSHHGKGLKILYFHFVIILTQPLHCSEFQISLLRIGIEWARYLPFFPGILKRNVLHRRNRVPRMPTCVEEGILSW
jgi:hypothetical protein